MTMRTKLAAAATAAIVLGFGVAGAKAAPQTGGLPAPTPLAPGAHASLPVTFDWTAVPGAQWYQIEVYDYDTLQTSDFTRTALANGYGIAFAVIPNGYLLQYGHTYGWRVAACYDASCGQFSPASAFTVDGYPGSSAPTSVAQALQTATIPANNAFNFSTGMSAPGSGDIYYSTVAGASYMGVTPFGSGEGLYDFGLVPFSSVSAQQVQTATYASTNYVDNKNGPADMKPGDLFAVSFGNGAYAIARVLSADYSQLTLQYIVID